MSNTAPALTVKESALLAAITAGMDEPGCGWLHELAPQTLSTNAVLGSLINKGLVHSHKEPGSFPGMPPAYWVELTPAGEAVPSAAAPAPVVAPELPQSIRYRRTASGYRVEWDEPSENF